MKLKSKRPLRIRPLTEKNADQLNQPVDGETNRGIRRQSPIHFEPLVAQYRGKLRLECKINEIAYQDSRQGLPKPEFVQRHRIYSVPNTLLV